MTETTIEPTQPRRLEKKAEVRVSILLYDALDFSTDHDDGGGQTRESLSGVATISAADAALDPARLAHQARRRTGTRLAFKRQALDTDASPVRAAFTTDKRMVAF